MTDAIAELELKPKTQREKLYERLMKPEEAQSFIRQRFPKITDIEWMSAILTEHLAGKPVILTRSLDDVTAVSLDLAGSVRMQEIVSEKTKDDAVIPLIVHKVTEFYRQPLITVGKKFKFIQEPSIRGDGAFFVFKGSYDALEKAIKASLEAGRRVENANRGYGLIKFLLEKDLKEYDFTKDELEQLRLQLRVGIKTGSAIQAISDLSQEELDNILDDEHIYDTKNDVLGNAPNTAARLEAAGKELIARHPELRQKPVLIIATPGDIENLERQTGARFKTSEPETIILKDKNWQSDVVLITGYKTSTAVSVPSEIRKEEVSELEQSLLNDLSVLQSGVEYWNQKAQELQFSIKPEEGIELFLLDEIFSIETSQRELEGLIEKGAVKIIESQFGKRIIVTQEHYEKSLALIGKEIDRKHRWASDVYETILGKLERKAKPEEGEAFYYRFLARQGFHLKEDSHKSKDVLFRAAIEAFNVEMFGLATIYTFEAEKISSQLHEAGRIKRRSALNFLRICAINDRRIDISDETTKKRMEAIKSNELESKVLEIEVDRDKLYGELTKQRICLEKDEEDTEILKQLIEKYKLHLPLIEELKETEFSDDFFKYKKGALMTIGQIYRLLGQSKKTSVEEKRAFLYKALDYAFVVERLCLEDLRKKKREKLFRDCLISIDGIVMSIDSITTIEKENNLGFSGKTANEVASELEVSEETAKICQMNYEQKLRYAIRKSCKEGSIARKRGYNLDSQRIYSNIAEFSFNIGDIRRAKFYLGLSEELFGKIESGEKYKQMMQQKLQDLKEKLAS